MRPTDFAKRLGDFLGKYLPAERGISPHTISSYRDTFVLLISYLEKLHKIRAEKLLLADLTTARIVAFLNWLQTERLSGDATRNVRLAAIHSFIRYLQYVQPDRMDQWQQILAVPLKKTEQGSVNYLSTEGMRLLLKQPDTSTKKGLRDLAFLALMYDSGARVQEVLDLTPAMVRLDKPFTVKLAGKGGKMRVVPLMEQQLVHLKRYMERNQLTEAHNNLHPLFFNSRKEKLTRAGANYILQEYTGKARKDDCSLIPNRISCHSLRHSKAMHLLQAGVHLVYIRDLLGHESVMTTEVYARADSRQKRNAIESAYQDLTPKQEPLWSNNNNLLEWLRGFL